MKKISSFGRIVLLACFVIAGARPALAEEKQNIDPMMVEVLDEVPQNATSLGRVEVVPDGDLGKDFSVLMAATKELKVKAAALGANAVVLEGFKKDPATGKVLVLGNALSISKQAK